MELNIITNREDLVASEKFRYKVIPGPILFMRLITIGLPVITLMTITFMSLFLNSRGVLDTKIILIFSILAIFGFIFCPFVLPGLMLKSLDKNEELDINRSYKQYLHGPRIIDIDNERIRTSITDKIYELPWDKVEVATEDGDHFFVYPLPDLNLDRVVIPKNQLDRPAVTDVRALLESHATFRKPKKA